MLTTKKLKKLCQHVLDCPAYLAKLEKYEKQAIENYAKTQLARLNTFAPAEREYYYAMDSEGLYSLSEKLLAIMATPINSPDLLQALFINGFTMQEWNNLLIGLRVLESDAQNVAPDIKPAVWVGIAAGLRKRQRLDDNRRQLAKALFARYGVKGTSTIEKGIETPTTEQWCAQVEARIPKL